MTLQQTLQRAASGGWLLAGALLLLLISAPAHANLAANVHFASGYVAATAPGQDARQLAKGDDIFRSDRIDTGDNGRVQMRFTDGGLVSLMPGSTFTVDEYFHEGGADDDASLVFGLLRGGLRTVTGTIGKTKHEQYELRTPVATLGIRGTEYIAVIRPANTLRVHVGRGKVVITNDHGTLEVAEGQNAVVTLGSAPEFSDQAPQYQATSPMGDRLIAQNQPKQDPHMLDPFANMPGTGPEHIVGLPQGEENVPGGGSPVSPPPPTQLPPGNYNLAAVFPSTTYMSTPYIEVASQLPLDFNSAGHFIADPQDFDTGSWQSFNVVTSGSVSWGELTDGIGFSNDVQLTDTQFAPYVIGSVPTTPLSGTLSFSLDGATPARAYSSGGANVGSGTLNQFDLGIDVSSLTYTLQMQVDMNSLGTYSVTNGSGNLSTAQSLPDFQFNSPVTHSGAGCGSGCNMNVQGFIAGSGGNQAGVVYDITDGSTEIIGAAGLTTP